MTKKTLLAILILLFTPSIMAANWRAAVGDGGGSTQEAMVAEFAKIVNAKTDGKIKIKLYVNGQLGSEQATINDLALGLLDLSIVGSSNLSPFAPSANLLAMPYLFDNIKQVEQVLEGPVAQSIADDIRKQANVRVIGWSYSGFRRLTNSKKMVKNIKDLQGLVIRVPKTSILLDSYKAWGINASPIAWTETFTALQQGVVDGQETSYISIDSMNFGEIQKYLTQTHYIFQIEPLLISEELYQKQTDEVKAILLEAGKQAQKYNYNWLIEKEDQVKKKLISKYKIQVNDLEDETVWAEKIKTKVWPKYYDQIGGKKRLNQVLLQIGKEPVN